jgi:hypothetical protein
MGAIDVIVSSRHAVGAARTSPTVMCTGTGLCADELPPAGALERREPAVERRANIRGCIAQVVLDDATLRSTWREAAR